MQHCGKGVQVLYLITLHMNYILLRKEEETMTQKKFSTKYLVEMALLVAIILIMAFTPIGYIRTAGLEITLIVVSGRSCYIRTGSRCDLRRCVWHYKFYPVLWHESVWCSTAWN